MNTDTVEMAEQLELLLQWLKEHEATLNINVPRIDGRYPYPFALQIKNKINYLTLDDLVKEVNKIEITKIKVTACDENSTATYSKLLEFASKEEFMAEFEKFKKEVPFKKWRTDLLDGNAKSPLMDVLEKICSGSLVKEPSPEPIKSELIIETEEVSEEGCGGVYYGVRVKVFQIDPVTNEKTKLKENSLQLFNYPKERI